MQPYLGMGVLHVEQAVDATLYVVLAAAAGVGIVRGLRGDERRLVVTTFALAAVAFAVRLVLAEPTFLHANHRGEALVNEILLFPDPVRSLGMYGQASFLFLGAASRLFGPRFETIAITNQAVSAATLGLVGLLAARWTGRRWCAPLAVVMGTLQVPLVRVAASEDAHNLAVLWGITAFFAMDVYAARKDRVALVAATAAACLMVGTRQTAYVWAPAVFAMAAARAGWSLFRRGELWIAGFAVLAALVARLAETISVEAEQVLMPLTMATQPALIAGLVLHHPLFDLSRYALVLLPLELWGLWGFGPLRRGYALLLLATFLITLPFGFPLPGVELSFRLPVMMLALVAAASGAERLLHVRYAGPLAIGAAALSPIALRGWSSLREPGPLLREYRFVRDEVHGLPEDMVLADLRIGGEAPGYRASHFRFPQGRGLRRIDVRSLRDEDTRRGTVFFLAGVQCRAYSVAELATVPQDVTDFGVLPDFFLAPVQRRVYRGVHAPSTLRPECARILAHAEPFGPSLRITPRDENPFILYGDAPITVQMYRLTGPPDPAPVQEAPRE